MPAGGHFDRKAAGAWTRGLPLTDAEGAFMVRAEAIHDLVERNPVLAGRVIYSGNGAGSPNGV